jgi:Uncharacterized protein, contains Trp-Asp (WD) repeat
MLFYRYLVCFSPRVDSPSQQHLVMYDIRTGAKERSFSVEQHSMWPVFRWSKDDKYFAKIEPDKLSVYQTPVSDGFLIRVDKVEYISSDQRR